MNHAPLTFDELDQAHDEYMEGEPLYIVALDHEVSQEYLIQAFDYNYSEG